MKIGIAAGNQIHAATNRAMNLATAIVLKIQEHPKTMVFTCFPVMQDNQGSKPALWKRDDLYVNKITQNLCIAKHHNPELYGFILGFY